MSLKGIAIRISSDFETASSKAEALVPVCFANSFKDCGPRLFATLTSCPDLASCFAKVPPCTPAPITPILMTLSFFLPISCVKLAV